MVGVQVIAARRKVNTLDHLSELYTKVLEAHADTVKVNRNQLWRQNKPLEAYC